MFQMMADTAGIAHTGCGNDHLRCRIKVDHLGFVAGNAQVQSRESDRIDPFMYQCQRLLRKTCLHILLKDFRSFYRQRRVHIDREIRKLRHQPPFLDLADVIQHLLGTAYRKGRDHQITAFLHRCRDDLCKLLHIIRPLRRMIAGTVGGFHDHIIRILYILRIPDQRALLITDIAGIHQLLCHITFRDPQLDAGRSQQMPYIGKAELNAFAQFIDFIILKRDQAAYRTDRVFHRIERFHLIGCTSLRLTVLPFRLLHLYMRAVTQHDGAQIHGRFRRHDLPAKAPGI